MPFKDKQRKRNYMRKYMKDYRVKQRELIRLGRELMKKRQQQTKQRKRKWK